MKLFEKYVTLFIDNGITTNLRLCHFMAQIEHESGLKPIAENLNYSADGLIKTFKKYFTKESALAYAGQQQRIANKVYANRMGNGNESSGDGWKFRGRGFIQTTGKENYLRLSNDTDIDFINNPDELLEEANAIVAALWFWNDKGLNKLADKDDIIGITKKINGGLNGIDDRKLLLEKYKKELL